MNSSIIVGPVKPHLGRQVVFVDKDTGGRRQLDVHLEGLLSPPRIRQLLLPGLPIAAQVRVVAHAAACGSAQPRSVITAQTKQILLYAGDGLSPCAAACKGSQLRSGRFAPNRPESKQPNPMKCMSRVCVSGLTASNCRDDTDRQINTNSSRAATCTSTAPRRKGLQS